MTDQPDAMKPASLLQGVYARAAMMLGVASVSHRSALLGLAPFDGPALVHAIHAEVAGNYARSGASANKDRSSQNWRWHAPQPQIAERNRSPEVVVERAVAAAAVKLGRRDWSNQIPVASGLVDGARDGRRAVDLVRQLGERHFELIELKIASDTPLYAAVEILGYACLWLVARGDRPARSTALLDAERLDLKVLAPAAFYARYALDGVEDALDKGVRLLEHEKGVALSFGFDVLDERIRAGSMPEPAELLALMDRPRPLHAA